MKSLAPSLPDIDVENHGYSVSSFRGSGNSGMTRLSHGERQTFVLVGDILWGCPDDTQLVAVDEPEMGLHPQQAASTWSALEAARPDAVFVYATHSLAFAMRPEIDRIFYIGQDRTLVELPRPTDLPGSVFRSLLGAVPGMLTVGRLLYCEDPEQGFTATMLRWLLRDDDVVVQGVGKRGNVLKALDTRDALRQLAAGAHVCGLVDRDFDTDTALAGLERKAIVLPLHESESYLCDPDVVLRLPEAGRAGLESEDDVWTHLRVHATRLLDTTKYERTRLILAQYNKGKRGYSEAVEADTAILVNALSTGGHDLLRLFPGKELALATAVALGFGDVDDYLQAVIRHVTAEDVPLLAALRAHVLESLKP